VLEASNGPTALRLLERHTPALVLLDLVLPEQSGLDLLTVLKSNRATPYAPIIAVTARTDLLARAELADAVVAKPFDVEEVLAKIGAIRRRPRPRANTAKSIAAPRTCQHGTNRGGFQARTICAPPRPRSGLPATILKELTALRDDIQPGSAFPDYELADHTGRKQRLSELQRDDPMILHLSRGHF